MLATRFVLDMAKAWKQITTSGANRQTLSHWKAFWPGRRPLKKDKMRQLRRKP